MHLGAGMMVPWIKGFPCKQSSEPMLEKKKKKEPGGGGTHHTAKADAGGSL